MSQPSGGSFLLLLLSAGLPGRAATCLLLAAAAKAVGKRRRRRAAPPGACVRGSSHLAARPEEPTPAPEALARARPACQRARLAAGLCALYLRLPLRPPAAALGGRLAGGLACSGCQLFQQPLRLCAFAGDPVELRGKASTSPAGFLLVALLFLMQKHRLPPSPLSWSVGNPSGNNPGGCLSVCRVVSLSVWALNILTPLVGGILGSKDWCFPLEGYSWQHACPLGWELTQRNHNQPLWQLRWGGADLWGTQNEACW